MSSLRAMHGAEPGRAESRHRINADLNQSAEEGRSEAAVGRTEAHFGREHPIPSPGLARKKRGRLNLCRAENGWSRIEREQKE